MAGTLTTTTTKETLEKLPQPPGKAYNHPEALQETCTRTFPDRGSVKRKRRLLGGGLVFAGRFTENLLVWQRVGEGRSAAGAVVRQFVLAGHSLDAARRPPGTDLVARRPGRTQRPSRTCLEASGSGGAKRSPGAGSVSGQLGGSQRSPTSARLAATLALLLALLRGLVSALHSGQLARGAGVAAEHFLSVAHHGLVALGGQRHRGQRHLEGGRGRGVELIGLGGAQFKVGGRMVAVLRQARRSAVHAEVTAGHLAHHLLLGTSGHWVISKTRGDARKKKHLQLAPMNFHKRPNL